MVCAPIDYRWLEESTDETSLRMTGPSRHRTSTTSRQRYNTERRHRHGGRNVPVSKSVRRQSRRGRSQARLAV